MRLLNLWADKIETTKPGDRYRTYRAGTKHATLCGVPIPLRSARWLWYARRFVVSLFLSVRRLVVSLFLSVFVCVLAWSETFPAPFVMTATWGQEVAVEVCDGARVRVKRRLVDAEGAPVRASAWDDGWEYVRAFSGQDGRAVNVYGDEDGYTSN